MLRVSDRAEPEEHSRSRAPQCCLPLAHQRRRSGLRGYPETNQQRHAYIKQHSCGNERQDDRMGQAYEA